ncbi:MAG: outer membrane beta-barrel protein, partial [Candidatus Omnitrophica bacterium]|nr:outer membrane beta-barrel protein [Candidatus Omnitrophota bacterium]
VLTISLIFLFTNSVLYLYAVEEKRGSAEDYYKTWAELFDKGEYEDSIPFMKKALQLDQSYSLKIRDHIDKSIEDEILYAELIEGKGSAEDYYKTWAELFDKGEYEDSIPFMKKALQLDPSYSLKIRDHIESYEQSLLAEVVEAKKEEVLAKEQARELREQKRGTKEEELAGRKPLKLGPLTMSPYINYRFIWDDNIFITKEDRKADYISEFMPGLGGRLDLPFGLPFISLGGGGIGAKMGAEDRTLIDLEYQPNFKNFFNDPKQSNVGHTFIGTSIIPSNLFGGRGKLVFGLKDIYRFTTDPATQEDVKFTPRYNNDMETKVKYAPTEKMSMAVAYRNVLEWYKAESMEEFSYDKYTITPTVYYNITSKSSLFLDADFVKTIYIAGNRTSTYLQISGGITGQITPKTAVYFKAGGQFREYAHDDLYGDYMRFTTSGSLTSWLRKDILMKILFAKYAAESIYQDNAFYDSKYADFELTKHLTGKLSIIGGVRLGKNDYQRDSTEEEGVRIRRDIVWGLRGGISYKLLKWLDSTVGYELSGRDSNFKKYYYRDNRVIGNLKAIY